MDRVTIVVPCYNEALRFDAKAFDHYLATVEHVDFVLVDDGSTDGTLEALRELQRRWPGRLSVLDQPENRGKAEAVRIGMLHAMAGGARYGGFWDADLATPLDAISEFTRALDRNPQIDLILGSRVQLLGRHIDRKPARHYLGRVFATAASAVLALPVYDTQCGAKLLRINDRTRALFAEPFGSRWIFDVELIARYQQGPSSREGIYELPLERWSDVGESKVRPVDFVRALGEMVAIFRRYHLGPQQPAWLRLLTAPFLRYAGAGVVGTCFHYAALIVLVELFTIHPSGATAVGATLGAFVNYSLNYHVTFVSKTAHKQTLPKFLAVAALVVTLNALALTPAVELLGLHYLVAQMLCTIAVLALGYAANKTWTFAARD